MAFSPSSRRLPRTLEGSSIPQAAGHRRQTTRSDLPSPISATCRAGDARKPGCDDRDHDGHTAPHERRSQEIEIIGFVITFHIVGMFFFTPVVGWLVDRIGPRSLIAVGGLILAIGAETAAHTSAEDRVGVFVGLFLVGLGWSFCFISGSSLLTASFPIEMRVTTQGSADLVMNGAGAIAALMAGVVYQFDTYYGLSHYSGFAAITLAAFAVWHMSQMSRKRPAVAS